MSYPYDYRPIGIFDSGVGGLTVLQELLVRFPQETFIYLGDTARVPYGTKSPATVQRYTIQVAEFLLRQEVKCLVAACNTASALGLPALRSHCTTPVLGVIEPGCQAAVGVLPGGIGRVGVIGTHATIASAAYARTLTLLVPECHIRSLSCPLFVPVVEEGWTSYPSAQLLIRESLQPFIDDPVDVLILGCTHYPILKSQIAAALGPKTILVDSAQAVALALNRMMGSGIVLPSAQRDTVRFYVTDAAPRFREVAARFLPQLEIDSIEVVDL
ncbi:MAG: glutamate racemase [Magnetococcales bacterium]|nr:glutamate racemase [Magnetococcales bacterium]MBF0149582.1 glutamate racemase [Magnetococcales bacterium]MBF0172403.1 glutamate racemase [Magnetococcales bacterium]MBF0348227.1 glutamate racemase [Magnetococcales bacterium]MBF0631051.1 glutamate racemase [Magnetococcales bacterium]